MIFLFKPCAVVDEAAFATATAFVTFVFSAPDVVVVVVVVVAVAGGVVVIVVVVVVVVAAAAKNIKMICDFNRN